jgi:hypothetical protein
MKHQRRYHILRRVTEIALPRLRFQVAWQERLGHWLLWQLNRVGARWVYETVRDERR